MAAAASLGAASFTIDGEVVICGPDGLSLFDELRRSDSADDAFLYAFDLLELEGEDLRPMPLIERKACRLGAEGIVSKRANAPYRSGRYSAWIKCKNPEAIAVQRPRSENWNSR
jgi:bifunctional non-homologous end joining protein LigD